MSKSCAAQDSHDSAIGKRLTDLSSLASTNQKELASLKKDLARLLKNCCPRGSTTPYTEEAVAQIRERYAVIAAAQKTKTGIHKMKKEPQMNL